MSNPYLIQVPFALNGDRNDIQTTKQQGQDPEDATWSIGFPPQTMIPESAGGLAPKGLDFNGLFYATSSIGAHYSRGDQIQFDATFAAKIGGYSKGFRLASNDYQRDFISLVDNNMVDPNGTNISQNWRVYAGQGSIPVATSTTNGTVKLIDSLSSTAKDAALTAAQGKVLNDILDIVAYSPTPYFGETPPIGWLIMDGQSITKSKYPKLFDRYGANLPDMRGIFIRGYGGNSANIGVLQNDDIKSHSHTTSLDRFSHGREGIGGALPRWSSGDALSTRTPSDTNILNSTGGSETRPKNIAFLYIVKAG